LWIALKTWEPSLLKPERRCVKCGDRIFYSAPDTHWLSLDRKGFWPEWSDAMCGKDGFHMRKKDEDIAHPAA
jgi:hypothetical protein